MLTIESNIIQLSVRSGHLKFKQKNLFKSGLT